MLHGIIHILLIFNILLEPISSTHVFNMDRDFSKLKTDQSVANSVQEVVRKLKTFKVPVHPRIRLLYGLLRQGMARHAQRQAESLYIPRVYRAAESAEA